MISGGIVEDFSIRIIPLGRFGASALWSLDGDVCVIFAVAVEGE